MSTSQAIATVTAALRQRLLEVVQADVPGSSVTALRPSDAGPGLPALGVNVFLFALHVNGAQRNRDLPLRRSTGELTQLPTVPLDLDYLISFYGDANGAAHLLAGSVMRSLYARPILTDAMIAAAETGTPLHSGLAAQPDRVRFTPVSLPLEEMSKLWSVFFQTSYALSVVFRAGPVLVEADAATQTRPPVLTPQVTGTVLRQPLVTAVQDAADPGLPIGPGSTVAILGQRLAAASVTVSVNGLDVTPAAVADTRIVLTLPPALPAGSLGLAVRQDILVGQPGAPRPGRASDLAAFVLHPLLVRAGGVDAITVTNLAGAGAAPRSATVAVGILPTVGAAQAASLELLDPAGAVAASVNASARTAGADTVSFAVANVPAGTYGVRVRIDGAESAVGADTTPGSPTLGQLVPQLVLP